MKRNRISPAFDRNALAVALAVVLTASNAVAQEQSSEPTVLDKIEVTGSRIKRADIEGALPITVIDRQEIETSGKTTVAELLQNTTFNSFGSFTPTSGSSAQSFSELSLRGLGGGRTLILIDGRRAPTAPNTGEGQDLNTLPLAAVERVEILTDGASAIYGADAMAGVVNIITRKDFDGVQVTGGISQSQRGGDTEEGSIIFGASGDRGRLLAGISYTNRGITYLRDLPWVQSGASTYSNNYLTVATNAETGETVPGSYLTVPGTSSAVVPGGCAGENFYTNASGSRCYYDFTTAMADTAAIDTKGFFARGDYQVSDRWTAYLSASLSRVDSFGVYAPVPESIFVSADSPNNVTGQDAYIKHRFAALGNRLTYTDADVSDVTFGFQGQLNDRITLDVGMRRNESRYNEVGYNYVNIPVAQQYFEDGTYNAFDPYSNSEEVLNAIRTTTNRKGFTKQDEIFALATVDLFEMAGGTSALAIGAEHRKEDYQDIYDQQSAAGNVGGSSGNSSWGSRTLTSAYAEWNLPILSNLEANLAVRHDDYSDFGDSTSPKVSLRYQPLGNLTLRASYGEGFRAPSLSVMNQQDAFSADSVVDEATATAYGLSPTTSIQINGLHVATPDLKPETSKQWSAGVVWDATDWLNLSADFYDIKIDNQIKWFSAQTVLNRTANDQYLPSHLYVTRNADGSILQVRAGYGNEGQINTSGVDLAARAKFDFGNWGALQSQLQVSLVDKYEVKSPYGSDDYLGTEGYPEWRATIGNRWTKGDFSLNWNVNIIGYEPAYYVDYYQGTYTCAELVDDGYASRCSGPYITHDVQGTWQAPWNGKVTIGVNNLTDKKPPYDAGYTNGYNSYLYYPYGRQIYLRYSQSF